MTVEELIEAIGRHPTAENDPEVADAVNAVEDALVQDYLDLDAAGFLMVALGHLTAAMKKLHQEPPSRAQYNAGQHTQIAANFVRDALKWLDELKEETCEKS